jgi:hypothetical protein
MNSAGVAIMLVPVMVAVGCGPRGQKVTSFGGLHFVGNGTCESVSIVGMPWPKDIVIKGTDGNEIKEDSLSVEHLTKRYGEPAEQWSDPSIGTYVEFREAGCAIVFKRDRFARLYGYSGVVVLNTTTGKSITLPATESELRSAFGRPTKVDYVTKIAP